MCCCATTRRARPIGRTWCGAPPSVPGRRQRRRGTMRDVEVQLAKRIPLQAGLGGGSSDAAAALRALGSVWGVDDRTLREMAVSLGADVPYFLEGGTVLGLDRGDRLYPLVDHRAAWVTLVLPGFGVSTAEAFRWWDEENPGGPDKVRPTSGSGVVGRTLSGPASGPASDLRNDLEDVVAARHPEIIANRQRAAACRRVPRRDVRQRLGGLRPVRQSPGGRRSGTSALERQTRDLDAHRQSRGLSTTCGDPGPSYKLTVCAPASGPLLRSISSHTAAKCSRTRWNAVTRRHGVGRGQAVRRGTLDPVFEGSNPSAPANW